MSPTVPVLSPALPQVHVGHRPGERAYRRILVGLLIGGFANFMLLYYVQPLLPTLAATYRVSAGASAEALSVSTLAMAAALLLVGPLSDVVGRLPLMRWSLLASAAFGLASAFAPTWTSLLVLRGLAGAALAGLPAVAVAYLREELHRDAHLGATATYITGTAVGGAAGRLLPGPLALLGGWSGATVVVGGLALGAAVSVWLLVPRSAAFTSASLDLRRMLHNLLATVRDPGLAAVCLLGCAGMGAFVGVYNAVAFRLESPTFGLGAGAVAVYLAYPVGIAAPWAARRLVPRLGRGTTVLAGLGLLGVGVLVTAAPTLPLIMAGLGVLTFAFLGVHSLASGWVVDRAQRLGIGVAQASSTYLLVYYCGSAFFGAFTTHRWETGGWSAVVITSLALVGVGLACAVVARRTER